MKSQSVRFHQRIEHLLFARDKVGKTMTPTKVSFRREGSQELDARLVRLGWKKSVSLGNFWSGGATIQQRQ